MMNGTCSFLMMYIRNVAQFHIFKLNTVLCLTLFSVKKQKKREGTGRSDIY